MIVLLARESVMGGHHSVSRAYRSENFGGWMRSWAAGTKVVIRMRHLGVCRRGSRETASNR